MSRIEMNGPDGKGGYRVALQDGDAGAVIPAELIAEQAASVDAVDAEEWIAAQSHEIARAIRMLANGITPPAPFDRIILTGDAP